MLICTIQNISTRNRGDRSVHIALLDLELFPPLPGW